jgi:hypothetical protein
MVQDQVSQSARSSITGGFVLVSPATLMAAWRACRADPLGVGDFRAWLACHELVARRCVAEPGRAPAYSVAELAGLQGVTPKRARASLNRLADAGLLQWSDSAIAFPEFPDGDATLGDTIGRGRGSLAIPRRVLRFLAQGAGLALIATTIAILLRWQGQAQGLLVRPSLRRRPPPGQGRQGPAHRTRMGRARGLRPVGPQPLGTRLPHRPRLVAPAPRIGHRRRPPPPSSGLGSRLDFDTPSPRLRPRFGTP